MSFTSQIKKGVIEVSEESNVQWSLISEENDHEPWCLTLKNISWNLAKVNGDSQYNGHCMVTIVLRIILLICEDPVSCGQPVKTQRISYNITRPEMIKIYVLTAAESWSIKH